MRSMGELIKHEQGHSKPYNSYPKFAGSLPIWNYASSQKELIRKIMWLNSRRIRSRRCISIISYTFDFPVLEDELQNRNMIMFWISFGNFALDQRSGDGRLGGPSYERHNEFEDIDSRILRCWMWRSLPLRRRSHRIHTLGKESVWQNRRLN